MTETYAIHEGPHIDALERTLAALNDNGLTGAQREYVERIRYSSKISKKTTTQAMSYGAVTGFTE